MDNRSLQAFVHLSETLHFSRASESCHVSPSTLSRMIQRLEETVGYRLLERDQRSVALTPQGELFLRYARDTLRNWDAFQNQLLEESGELQGEVSVYCSVTASYSFLFEVLRRFHQQHPRIQIKLHTGDPEMATSRVMAGQEEISIGARPDRLPAELAFKSMAVTPLVFIRAGNDGAGRVDWAQVPMIMPERGVARDRLDRWFRERGIQPNVSAQVAGNEAIVSMIALGDGVGLVPRIVLDNSPLLDRVHIVRTRSRLQHLELGLFTLRRRLDSPLIRALWSSLETASS